MYCKWYGFECMELFNNNLAWLSILLAVDIDVTVTEHLQRSDTEFSFCKKIITSFTFTDADPKVSVECIYRQTL